MRKQTDRMWRLAEAEEKLSKWEAVFGHLGTPDEVGNEWLALTDRLKKVEAANKEWLEKTEWVQAEINNWTLPMRYLGQHRADVIRAEVDALRAKIAEMEKQEPVATIHINSITGNPSVDFIPGHRYLHHNSSLYALPGAQPVPEKLCYDSRWEIPIDYVDGWNAAVDMMRGKSPSWHCPDCCIAFPFGAPKACPHDDSRCNKLLADAKESA